MTLDAGGIEECNGGINMLRLSAPSTWQDQETFRFFFLWEVKIELQMKRYKIGRNKIVETLKVIFWEHNVMVNFELEKHKFRK